jgi:hypothetical protein
MGRRGRPQKETFRRTLLLLIEGVFAKVYLQKFSICTTTAR